MTIGERIVEVRKAEGLNQVEFAKKLVLTKQTISNYETGARQPSLDIILKISDIFNVSTDYLLGKSEIKNLEKQSLAEIIAERISILDSDGIKLTTTICEKFIDTIKLSISRTEFSPSPIYNIEILAKLEQLIYALGEYMDQAKEDIVNEHRFQQIVHLMDRKSISLCEEKLKIKKEVYFKELIYSLNDLIGSFDPLRYRITKSIDKSEK